MDGLSPEDKANKIRGYHATLSNPTVSNEAKETAKQELKNLGAGDFDYESKIPDEQNNNPGNVAGGLKAAMHNPNVSAEGQAQAEEKLNNM